MNPRNSGLENQEVRELFEAWWDRDADRFRGYFANAVLGPVPPRTFDIFDKFFTDKNKLNRITLIVNTMAATLVACEEADVHPNIRPDCTGLPMLHLFAVTMVGNPRSITHIATAATPVTDKFGIWFAGSP